MKKLLWINLGLFVCLAAHADEELEPVSNMFSSGMERHEIAMIATASTRCGTLNLVVGEIIARDTPDTATVASLRELGNGLLMIGLYSNAALMKLRGADVDMADLQERALNRRRCSWKSMVSVWSETKPEQAKCGIVMRSSRQI